MSLEREDFMIVDTSGEEQDIHEEPNIFNGCIPQVKPLLPVGSDSSGSSSSSSYYTANSSFDTSSSSSSSSSSSLYFTPNASFEEEKPCAYFLKDEMTKHILSMEPPETIARRQETKLEQTADRELEEILKERDLASDSEQRNFHMDMDSEPEPWGEDDDRWVTCDRYSASMANTRGDTNSTEAAETVAPLASPSRIIRSIARSDTEIIEPSMISSTTSTPLDIRNWRQPHPLRRQHMKRWNI